VATSVLIRGWWAVMRKISFVLTLCVVLTGCGRHDDDSRDHSAAREAGRAAYHLSQETKKAAKEAGRELDRAAREAHKGWNDAKHDAKSDHH